MPTTTYRMNPWPIGFIWMSALVFMTFTRWTGSQFSLALSPSVDGFFWVMASLIGLATYLIWRYFVVGVTESGIRAKDGLGRFHSVKWEDIRSVKKILGFLFVSHGRVGKALTVPVFLTHFGKFRADVIARTPPENPLRQYLQKMPSV